VPWPGLAPQDPGRTVSMNPIDSFVATAMGVNSCPPPMDGK